jgi:hypothetical protein
VRPKERFAKLNIRVMDLVVLLLLGLFLTGIGLVGVHMFSVGGSPARMEVELLATFGSIAAFLLVLLIYCRRHPAAISRKREAVVMASSIPVALLAGALYRMTGEEWPIIVVICIGLPIVLIWGFLGDQMPSREERRSRKRNP